MYALRTYFFYSGSVHISTLEEAENLIETIAANVLELSFNPLRGKKCLCEEPIVITRELINSNFTTAAKSGEFLFQSSYEGKN